MSCTLYFYLSDQRIPQDREIKKAFQNWAKQGSGGKNNALESCDIEAMGGDPIDSFNGDFEGFYEKYKDLKRGTTGHSEPPAPSRSSDPPEPEDESDDLADATPKELVVRSPTRSTSPDDSFNWTEEDDDWDMPGGIRDDPPPPPLTDFDATGIFLKPEVVANQNFTTFDFTEEILDDLLTSGQSSLSDEQLAVSSLYSTVEDLQRQYQKAAVLNNGQVIVAVRPQTFYTKLPEDSHVIIPGVKPIANFGIPIATCTYLILTKNPSEFYRLDFNLTLTAGGPTAYKASLEKFGKEGGEEKSLYTLSIDLMPLLTNPHLLFGPPQKIKLKVHLQKEEGTTSPNPQIAKLMQAYTEAWQSTAVTLTPFDMSQEEYDDLLQNPFIPQFIKDSIDTSALERLSTSSGPTLGSAPAVEEEPLYSNFTIEGNSIKPNQPFSFAPEKLEILEENKPVLDEIVKYLQDNPQIKIRIEGHTDNQENGGNDLTNMELSINRTIAIKHYLISKGINNNRLLETVGHGENQPIDTNDTDQGRANNRRVEFVIIN